MARDTLDTNAALTRLFAMCAVQDALLLSLVQHSPNPSAVRDSFVAHTRTWESILLYGDFSDADVAECQQYTNLLLARVEAEVTTSRATTRPAKKRAAPRTTSVKKRRAPR